MFYTSIYDNYQIRDCTYIGKPPIDDKYRFDLVKWQRREELTPIYNKEGVKIMPARSCYTIARLIFNPKEEEFELQSVGMRFLEAAPSQSVLKWITRWCQHKAIELLNDE